jgi:hypothetical protein
MNITEEALQNNIIFDRYLDSTLILPYQFEQIRIQANDTVSSELLNIKIKHLHDNFLYLYKQTLIASNLIPISSTAIAGITGSDTQVTFYYNASTSQFVPLSTEAVYTGVDNTNLMAIVKNENTSNFSVFAGYNTALRVINFDFDGRYFNNVFTTSEVNPGFGVIFKALTAMATSDKYLFVVDAKLNQIVKYDISGFTSDNNISKNNLIYVDSIGNFGTSFSKSEFNSPRGVAIYSNILYILDSGNSCIKKYDLNFNWIETYRLNIDLLSSYPIDIGVDNLNRPYILTNDSFIFRYDSEFQNKQLFNLNTFKLENETFNKIVFSKNNTNVFYLISDRNVYKKFVSDPNNTIGKYLLYLSKYDISEDKITAFGSTSAIGCDKNMVFTRFGNTGKFGLFYDNLNLYDILAARNFDVYNYDEIVFNKNEYLQNWVFNKNISKIIINHMRLRDQIIGKFIAVKDNRGNPVFRGSRYLLPFELNSILFEQSITSYLGANEILNNNIVNRVLKNIFDIQELLLNALKPDNQKTPLLYIPINLN